MGIKGTVRRSTDGHIIHANIDTDVIIAEEPPYGMCFYGMLYFCDVSFSLSESLEFSWEMCSMLRLVQH